MVAMRELLTHFLVPGRNESGHGGCRLFIYFLPNRSTSALPEESPSSKTCPPLGSGDWGCVRSSDEEEDSPLPACTAPLSEFLSGDLYMKPQTCCRCESVHATVPAVAENPLELRRLLPAPGGLCATRSEIPATVPKLAFPHTLLPSRESMHLS